MQETKQPESAQKAEDKGNLPYGPLFYVVRQIIRIFVKKLKVDGYSPDKPVVFVGHHQNLKGAFSIMAWLKMPVRIWSYYKFCSAKECYRQYIDYTFTKRKGWPKFLAAPYAWVASKFVSRLMASMHAIPVYRSSAKILGTLSESAALLKEGKNILIFPDIDYTNETEQTLSLYTGFINIDKYYWQQTGEHIEFVPLTKRENKGILHIGEPSVILDGEPFLEAKKRVASELLEKLNSD